MIIGIDGRALTGRFTGDRTYWLNLIRAHAGAEEPDYQYIVYTRLPMLEDPGILSPRITFRTIPATNDRIWTLATFPRALRQDGVDLAHTQYTTPLRTPCPIITTVHDISFRLYPEWFPKRHRMLLNWSVPGAMRRAARVITDSMSSRRDILRIYRLSERHVTAIPLAAPPDMGPVDTNLARRRVAESYGLDGPYIISVGVLQPRKNLPMLIEAYARARHGAGLSHKLVLAGKRGWAYDEIAVQIARLRVSADVLITDYVADGDLPALYSAADMMAFPSLYEGFGLPPLEAMACGAPTIVSDAPAMPEVVADGALVLPVMDSAAWADGLSLLASSESARRDFAEAGRARANQFSWATTARETRRIYSEVLSGQMSRAEAVSPP